MISAAYFGFGFLAILGLVGAWLAKSESAKLAVYKAVCVGAVLAGVLGVFGFGEILISEPVLVAWEPTGWLFEPRFMIDRLGAFFSLIICLVGAVAAGYSLGYAPEIRGDRAVFSSMFVLFLLSMLGVAASDDVFGFIVLWEVMTLISALMLKFNDDGEASNGVVMRYLGISQVGAFAILVGLFIISSALDTTRFSQWQEMSSLAAVAAGLFLMIGFSSKAGLWPFHVWLPEAHPLASSNISALMSGVMIKMALFGAVKFVFILYLPYWIGLVVLAVGAISAILGAANAITASEYKRVVAYSSVENMGLIFMGVGAALWGKAVGNDAIAVIGLVAALFHAFNHSLFKSLLFLGCGAVHLISGESKIQNLGGLARSMPIIAISVATGAAAVAAVPPLNGFISEWFLYRALLFGAMGDGVVVRLAFVLSVLAVSVVGALVVWAIVRFYGGIFLGASRRKSGDADKENIYMSLACAILAVLCVLAGLGADFIIAYISDIAAVWSHSQSVGGVASGVAMPLVAVVLIGALIIPLILMMVLRANRSEPKVSEPWACGFKYSASMVNMESFAGDIKRIFAAIFRFKAKRSGDGHFAKISYEAKVNDWWWGVLYGWIVRGCVVAADKIGIVQNGRSSYYLVYMLIYLYAVMAWALV